jgi:hypothetical protein
MTITRGGRPWPERRTTFHRVSVPCRQGIHENCLRRYYLGVTMTNNKIHSQCSCICHQVQGNGK